MSSNISSLHRQYFNAYEHLSQVCKQHNVDLLTEAHIQYPLGWNVIVLFFINELKQYPVRIVEVIDLYGQLDIQFKMKEEKDEVKVWRLVQKCRIESRTICMECGNITTANLTLGNCRRYCSRCYGIAEKLALIAYE